MKVFFTALSNAKNVALSMFFCLPMVATAQTVMTQGFDGATLAEHIDASGADVDKFNAISTSGTSSIYLASSKLVLQRASAAAGFVRTTDFSPTPSVLKIKFKVTAAGNASTLTNNSTVFQVGSAFTTTMSAEATTNVHSRLSVGLSATNGIFHLRNLTTGTNTTDYNAEQEVSWYINNSGAAINYTDPSGMAQSLADDVSDVWVGATRVFTAIPAVTVGQTLTDFKCVFAAGTGTVRIDNLVITRDATVLPVSLTDFKAKKAGTTNQLTWATESETNNKGYDVQRQNQAGEWEILGFVNGTGKAATYTFEDKGPLSISYYRLRQIDFDGKETLSKVISVSQDTKSRPRITPNPTSDKVTIDLNQNDVSNQTATVILSDMTGRQVLTQTTTAGAFQLDLSHLAKGMYLMTVQSNNAIYQEKIIRQ